MVPNNAYAQYRDNSIQTASKEDLTLMLYNGLVKFLMQAENAVAEDHAEKAHHAVIRAQDIIREFQMSLDMQYEVSQGLMLMYDYMYRRLVDANVKKDAEIIAEILGYAKELRDTWAEAMKLAKQQKSGTKMTASVVNE